MVFGGLPQWLSNKESSCNAGDTGDPHSVPRQGRSPGGAYGNPFQYSCLGNPMNRRPQSMGSQSLKQLSTAQCKHMTFCVWFISVYNLWEFKRRVCHCHCKTKNKTKSTGCSLAWLSFTFSSKLPITARVLAETDAHLERSTQESLMEALFREGLVK